MVPAGGPPRHVKAALGIDADRIQEPIDPPDPQFGKVGEGRSQVGRADRRQAQDPPSPARSAQQPPRIKPTHAVADQVHRLIGENAVDLLAQDVRPRLDTGDRGNPRDQHPIAGGLERLGDASEIRRQGQSAQADPAEPEQPMSQHDRRGQPGKRGRVKLQSRHGARLYDSYAL